MPAHDADPAVDRELGHRRALRTVARQSTLQFAGAIATAVFGFLLVIVATRTLGPTRAGAFLVGIGLFQIVANLAQLGADTGLVRMIPRYRAIGRAHDVRRTLAIALVPVVVAGTALGVGAYVAAPRLAQLLSHEQDPEIVLPFVRHLALFVPLAALTSVALAGTRGFGTVVPSVAVDGIGKPLVRPFLLAAAVAFGLGDLGVSMSYALPVLAGSLVSLAWLLRLEERSMRGLPRETPPAPGGGSIGREFWSYSWPRALQGFFTTASLWLDVLLLSGLRSTGEAGVYTAATRFMIVGVAALQAIVLVISPQVSGFLAAEERDRAQAVYQTSTWWLMAFTWPTYLATAVYAPLLLGVFGRGFERGVDTVVILSLASLVNMATGAVGSVLLMGGYSVLGLVVGGLSLALNIALNLVLIPRFGMTGAAAAWAATIVLTNLTALFFAVRWMRLAPFGKGFAVVAGASVLCYGALGLVARTLLGTGVASLAVYAVVATASYAAVLRRYRRELRLSVLMSAFHARRNREPLAGPTPVG